MIPKKLYHISFNILNEIELFEPSIPSEKVRLLNEDNCTPRICLAPTIKDCLNAIPNGGRYFKETYMLSENNSKPFVVYEFDTNQIEKENFLDSESLFESNKLPDALLTNECWVINQNLVPSNSKKYIVTDLIIDFAENKSELEEDGTMFDLGIYGDDYLLIRNLNLKLKEIIEYAEVDLFYVEFNEKTNVTELIDYIKSNYPVSFISRLNSTLEVKLLYDETISFDPIFDFCNEKGYEPIEIYI